MNKTTEDSKEDSRADRFEKLAIRIVVGALVVVAVSFAVHFSIPQHEHLPSVALGQPALYRIEICLAIAYGGLLLLTPLFHGLLRGTLPIEIGQGGAKWPQAASAANVTLDGLDAAVKSLQHDLTDIQAKIVAAELAQTLGEG